MSVSDSDDQLQQLRLMKDRIDRAFQDLVTEIQGNMPDVDKKLDATESIDIDTTPF